MARSQPTSPVLAGSGPNHASQTSPDPQDGSGQGLGREYLYGCFSKIPPFAVQAGEKLGCNPPLQAAVIECLRRGGEGGREGEEDKKRKN